MTQPENAADHPRSKPTVSECKKTKKLAGIDMFDMSDTRTDILSYLLIMVWIPLFLDPSDGVFGRFDLAALCGCRTLNFCLFVY